MTELTTEKRAQWRATAERGIIFNSWEMLMALDALDAADSKLLELQTLIRDASGAGDQL